MAVLVIVDALPKAIQFERVGDVGSLLSAE